MNHLTAILLGGALGAVAGAIIAMYRVQRAAIDSRVAAYQRGLRDGAILGTGWSTPVDYPVDTRPYEGRPGKWVRQ